MTTRLPLLFGLYTALAVAGTLVMKQSAAEALTRLGAGDWRDGQVLVLMLGGLLHVSSFLVWILILAGAPATRAYPIAVGLTMAGIAIGGSVWLGESIGLPQIAGMLLVMGGIVLLATSSA